MNLAPRSRFTSTTSNLAEGGTFSTSNNDFFVLILHPPRRLGSRGQPQKQKRPRGRQFALRAQHPLSLRDRALLRF